VTAAAELGYTYTLGTEDATAVVATAVVSSHGVVAAVVAAAEVETAGLE